MLRVNSMLGDKDNVKVFHNRQAPPVYLLRLGKTSTNADILNLWDIRVYIQSLWTRIGVS